LRRSTRRLGTIAALSAATALVTFTGAGSAQAADDKGSTQTLRAEHNLGICESQAGDLALPFTVYRNDRVVVSAGSTIWSGVWGEPRVSPVGKTSKITIFDTMYADNASYPLPGARKYGLLLKMDGSYWPTGTAYSRFATAATGQQVAVRINDDVPGNGNGCFSVNVKLYR
jgi:hypothetical protein